MWNSEQKSVANQNENDYHIKSWQNIQFRIKAEIDIAPGPKPKIKRQPLSRLDKINEVFNKVQNECIAFMPKQEKAMDLSRVKNEPRGIYFNSFIFTKIRKTMSFECC